MFVSLFFGYFYSRNHTEGNTVGAGEQGKVVLDVSSKNVHLSRPSSQKKNLVEDDGTLLDKNNT